ncbi:MAG: aminoglycoside phosphotransferase family protein, partial [Dongiaceae bacterium]
HRQPNEAAKKLPPYDDVRLACEALWATEWYVPLVLPKPLGLTIREEYIDLWVKTFPLARIAGEHAIHRDFHVDNLMLLPKETGIARCGMLDFQDAVYGSIAYDLVSLLQDARLDVPEDVVEACLQKYLSSLPKSKHEDFMMAYAILGAQRAAKILGNFTRLKVRDDKGYLLCHIPRVWGYIERNVKHPALKDIKEWFDFHVPPEYRGLKGRLAA